MTELQESTSNQDFSVYDEFLSRIENASVIWELEDLKRAIADHEKFSELKSLILVCDRKISKIQNEQKEADYLFAKSGYENAKTVREFEGIKKLFQELGNYSDAEYYVTYCDLRIEELSSGVSENKKEDTPKEAASPVKSTYESPKTKPEPDFEVEETIEIDYSKVRKRVPESTHEFKVKSARFLANIIRLITVELVYLMALFFFAIMVFCLILVAVSDTTNVAVRFGVIMFIIASVFCLAKMIYPPLCLIPAFARLEDSIPGIRELRNSENALLQVMIPLIIQFIISIVFWTVWTLVLITVCSFY